MTSLDTLRPLCYQYYGLSVVKCRRLAYEFVTKNNLNMPDNWARDRKAGVEWMMSFKSRHGLAIRQPEATSLARTTAFNRYVVDQFYDNLATVMDKYKCASKDIFNIPILLIMDNHETHMSLAAVDLAKANEIVLLTIPPHTSHRLQPLDRTVAISRMRILLRWTAGCVPIPHELSLSSMCRKSSKLPRLLL